MTNRRKRQFNEGSPPSEPEAVTRTMRLLGIEDAETYESLYARVIGLSETADNQTCTGPVPMILTCPACGERHIDVGEFATRSHTTHACQHCGMCWRPAVVPTVGVQFLPGFKNEESK